MNFSAWSIRNPVAPLLGFFLLMVVGAHAFFNLPITRFPNIDVPIVNVTVTQSGASPAELEMQVTKEIEDAVASINGIDEIQTTVTDGQSQTVVIFRLEVPTEQAVQDTKYAIDRIRGNMPSTIDEPIVSKVDVVGQAIQSFAVSSPNMSLEELSWFVDDTVKRALQGKPGIGRVDRYGGADREVRIELDPNKLNAYGITALSVSQQLRSTNTDLGSGRGQVAGSEQAIRVLGDARNVAQLADTTIALTNGRFVKLSDLGAIKDTYQEPKSFSRFNSAPVVTFGVFRAKGASEVTVAQLVSDTLDKVRAENPNVSIEKIDDAVYYTYGNYESAMHTLIEGAILAVIVVFLFLRNWRATLISAVALPLSAIPTFWVMNQIGFSLNLVSFLALTLATGILVDDAIVEIENIARHIKMGKTPYRAAIDAADEIGLAVIATTFTIIAVFVPVSFMPGIPGQYFIQFGLTVAFSVFFSLLVARLITPMMAAYLMRAEDGVDDHHDNDGRFMRGYSWLVRVTTKKWYTRYPTLLAAFAFSVASVFALIMFVPGSFIPPEDSSRIVLSAELPPNARLDDTEQATNEIYRRVKGIDGVESVFVLGGASPKGDLELRRATVTLTLGKLDQSLTKKLVNDLLGSTPVIGLYLPKVAVHGRIRPQWDIEKEVFAKLSSIPDVRITKLNDRGDRDLTYNFLSRSEKDLNQAVGILEAKLRTDPALANVSADGALPRPELQIFPRKDEAARLGITPQMISDTIRVATIGDIDASLAKISLDVGLMLVLTVLILMFKDVIQPFTILLSLPLAIGGVALALIMTGNALSMPVMIGILMLMGIVTKNAILLVDFAIEMMHQGMPRLEAVVEAGRKRARPIIMTSIAMSAGMLPSALGVGEGGSFRAPMAIAVIGGIIVSTVLSLVVVPSFFLIMDDLSRLLGYLFGRLVGRKDADDKVVTKEGLAVAVNENRQSLTNLEERLEAIENKDGRGRTVGTNVLKLPPFAAE